MMRSKTLRLILYAALLLLMLSAFIGCESHTEHTWVENSTLSTAATCAEAGTAAYYCSECEETKTETVSATGHSMQLTSEIPLTCETDGVKNYKCENCGKTETESLPAPGHNMKPSNRQDPTCELDGFQNYKCNNCEKAYAENLPAPGHDMKPSGHLEPTCETDGIQSYKCGNCENTASETVVALGHDMKPTDKVAPTCEKLGAQNYRCARCEKTDTTVLPATEHSYKTQYIAPTYTTNGKRYKECLICSKTELLMELTMLDKNFIESNISILTVNSQTNVNRLLTDEQRKKLYGYNGNTTGSELGNAMALTGIDENGKVTILTPEYGKPTLALPAGATYYLKLSSFLAFSAEFTFTPDPQAMAAAGVRKTQDKNGDTTYDISEYDTLTLTLYIPKEMTVLPDYTYMILVDCGQNDSGWSYFAAERNVVASQNACGARTLTIQLSDMKQYKKASLTTFKNISLRFTGWANGPGRDGVPEDGYALYVSSISLGRKDLIDIPAPDAGYLKCTHTLDDGTSAFERITVAPTCVCAGYDADRCSLCHKVNVVDDYSAYKPIGTHSYVTAESDDGKSIVRYCKTCDYREERVYGYVDPEGQIPTYGFFMTPELDYNGLEYKNTTTHSIFGMNLILRESALTRREDDDGWAYYDYQRFGSSHSYLEVKPTVNYFPNHFVFEVSLRLGEPDANGYYPGGTFQMIERGVTDTFLTFATLNAEGVFTFPNCDTQIALTRDDFTTVSIALHTDINRYDLYKDGVMIAHDIPISTTVDTASFNMSEVRFMQFSKNSSYGIGASIHIAGIYIYHGGLPICVEVGEEIALPSIGKED